MRYPLNSSTSVSPSSGRLKTLRCSTKLAKKDKIDKIVNNVVLQILQITHLPGHLERPEYECRPPCSTPQKQKVTEHVSCEGYSRVSGQWSRRERVACTVRCGGVRGRTPSHRASLRMYSAGRWRDDVLPVFNCSTVLFRVMLSLYSVVFRVRVGAYVSAY